MSSSSKSSASISTEASINPLTIRTAQPPTASTVSTSKSLPIDDRRLYIGNLDSTIDDGPKKGTPRGYCFLEYETSSQAAVAIKQMNRRSLKNRPLIVSLANIAPPSTDHHHDGRKRTQDPNRPTAFSILKAGALKNASTDEKIRAMERKLAQMTESSNASATSTSTPAHHSLPSRPAESKSGAGSSSSLSSSRTTTTSSSSSTHRGAGAGSNSSARQRPY
ncbi:hypothetical protein BGZ96_011553 [Linnemannia gamsii]|uniref:RRM domain-containing protein n=1 Tax=Linnemannia gamsii TaxID=64522 RepID=A0ABQ7JS15_9FUNG|nr:hypothetical protein BGZ96_011553 [Linnemannia gamsii]